jgi:hypothetical protein
MELHIPDLLAKLIKEHFSEEKTSDKKRYVNNPPPLHISLQNPLMGAVPFPW